MILVVFGWKTLTLQDVFTFCPMLLVIHFIKLWSYFYNIIVGPLNYNFFLKIFLFIYLFYCCTRWGYIVAFTKVLIIYHNWINLLHYFSSFCLFLLQIFRIVYLFSHNLLQNTMYLNVLDVSVSKWTVIYCIYFFWLPKYHKIT
jgi:hypothetical protein